MRPFVTLSSGSGEPVVVDIREIAAVEPSTVSGSRVHLRSGTVLYPRETVLEVIEALRRSALEVATSG